MRESYAVNLGIGQPWLDVLTVADGHANVTSYDYDTQFRLTEVTDDEGKEVHYTYDTDGRVTQVGAGTTGTFDKTVYTYNSTTGLLTQVTYYTGSTGYSANYYYDDAARVVTPLPTISASPKPSSRPRPARTRVPSRYAQPARLSIDLGHFGSWARPFLRWKNSS